MRVPRSRTSWLENFQNALQQESIKNSWSRWCKAGADALTLHIYFALCSMEAPTSPELRSRIVSVTRPMKEQWKANQQRMFFGEEPIKGKPGKLWSRNEFLKLRKQIDLLAKSIQEFGTLEIVSELEHHLPSIVELRRHLPPGSGDLAAQLRNYSNIVHLASLFAAKYRVPDRKQTKTAFLAMLCFYLQKKTGSVPYAEIANMLDALGRGTADTPVTEPALRQRMFRFQTDHATAYNRLRQSVRKSPNDMFRHLQVIATRNR